MHSYRRSTCAWALAFATVVVGASPARAQSDIDLGNLGNAGFRIEGADPIERWGGTVSGAGDVNGDGLADVVLGANFAFPGGESFVVFGKADNATVDVGNPGNTGFLISNSTGSTASGAGDVNGDGLADVVVGCGAVAGGCVVFGKGSTTTVDTANLGSGGFQVVGLPSDNRLGSSSSGAGDVNGDGLADLVLGASGADPNGRLDAGSSFVVFGRSASTSVDVTNLGNGGFRIDGAVAGDVSGSFVSGAGDVNGDGLADLIVGASLASPGGRTDAGASYVVFGKADNLTVDLANLGDGGFAINGAAPNDQAGIVSGAGDVNGDGAADVIVGAVRASPGGVLEAGSSYVVFGKANAFTIELATLGSGGFRIDGIAAGNRAGRTVAGAGDVNGDGRADLLVGSNTAAAGGDSNAGESYVVFGKTSSTTVELASLGSGGFRILGADPDDQSGSSVSGAGDVNGDGLADVVIGAIGADPGGQNFAGAGYVVFSQASPLLSASYRARSSNGNSPRVPVGTNGDGSNANHPDARAWIDFADGDDLIGTASTEVVTVNRSAGGFPGAAASVNWRLQTTRQNVSSVELRLHYLASELSIGNEDAWRVVYSPNGAAPFTPLTSVVNSLDNTISANATQPGFFYLGQRVLADPIFANGFE